MPFLNLMCKSKKILAVRQRTLQECHLVSKLICGFLFNSLLPKAYYCNRINLKTIGVQ